MSRKSRKSRQRERPERRYVRVATEAGVGMPNALAIDRLMGEDADDRAIREAHGFTFEDDWQDPSLLCRNGCGLSYPDVSAGKIRECQGAR